MEQIISAVSTYKAQTNWIYTDNPIVAIHTKLLIPPEVAVVTIKRLKKQDNYEQKLLKILQLYRPEQIVFMVYYYKQLRFNPQIMSYIDKHCKPITKNSKIQHYVLKSIAR